MWPQANYFDIHLKLIRKAESQGHLVGSVGRVCDS